MKNIDKPKTVLAVAAHADDNEFCFGGTISKWVKAGVDVHYLIISDGRRGTANSDLSSSETMASRKREQQNAADILGISTVTQFEYEDGRLESNLKLKTDIVKHIRELKPDTVLVMDPSFLYSAEYEYINHSDHRVVGRATLDSIYPLARDKDSIEEISDLPTHKVRQIFMYNLEKQDTFVDITSELDDKVKALKAHKSQFGDGSEIKSLVKKHAQLSGQKGGYKYSEGYVFLRVN